MFIGLSAQICVNLWEAFGLQPLIAFPMPAAATFRCIPCVVGRIRAVAIALLRSVFMERSETSVVAFSGLLVLAQRPSKEQDRRDDEDHYR